MMKKAGFTLAEVLITLTIIGVVAMMTLPSLMTNVQEQQAKTGLKKGINTLVEAAQMNQAVDGFDYASLRAETANDIDGILREQTLRGLLLNRAQVDMETSVFSATAAANAQPVTKIREGAATAAQDRVIFFRDGSALLYNVADTVATAALTARQDDGLPLGFVAIYDTNGAKGPNMLSNCSGVTDAVADGAVTSLANDNGDGANANACNNRGQRIIRDQFLLQLRGGYVTPVGPAARWAAEN